MGVRGEEREMGGRERMNLGMILFIIIAGAQTSSKVHYSKTATIIYWW